MTRPLPTGTPERLHPLLRVTTVLGGVAVLLGLVVLAPDVLGTQAVVSSSLRATQELPYVAAHRGDAVTGPENTMAAFRAAVAGGVDLIEADVQLTADRVPVLLHDTTVDRTTDGTGPVSELTFEQVRELDAGWWFAGRYGGTRIPMLDELLNFLMLEATEVNAIIEIKGDWTVNDTRLLVSSVRSRDLVERVVFASFSTESLLAVREAGPEIERGLLLAHLPVNPVAAAAEVDAIAILTKLDAVRGRAWVVDDIHAAGLGLLVYTLNEDHDWDRAIQLGVDGIITDRPGGLGSWMRDS